MNSPESTPTTPETRYPIEFSDFVERHPSALKIRDRVFDIYETRGKLQKDVYSDAGSLPHDEWPKQSDIEGYLGAGHFKSAYVIDGEYVVKIQTPNPSLKDDSPFGEEAREEYALGVKLDVDDLLRGVGVDGLEQLVTADPENGVIVTKLAKGRPLPQISSATLLKSITSAHLQKLDTTLEHMRTNLLEFDNPHNVLFDPEEGFTIIDYRTPLDLKPNEEYSVNIEDDNWSRSYVQFLKDHTLQGALNILLKSRKKEIKQLLDVNGEQDTRLAPTLGRLIMRSVVKLKAR